MSGRTLLQIAMSDFHSSNPKEKLVLIGLISHADPDGYNAFPGKGKLAAYAGCSVESVKRYLRKLRASEVIVGYDSERRDAVLPKNRRPTAYRINPSKFAEYAAWEKSQGGHPDDPSEGGQNDSTSQSLGGHPDDPSRGVTQMTPNQTYIPTTSNNSQSLLSTTSSAGVESETEAQYARDNDPHHGDSEGRDGVGDEPVPETPSPELKAAWNSPAQPVDFSKLTFASLHASQIESEPLDPSNIVSTGITAEEAERQQMRFLADQQRASQPPSIPGGQSPTEAPKGRENAAQRLQNPDPKAKRFGWEPSQAAYDHAKAICPDVNLDIIITEYWMWCHDKRVSPSVTHWMKWVTKAQKEIEAERAEKRRAEALEQREQKPWYEKDLKF